MTFDTIVRGGNIDVVIADGVIADVAPSGELGDDAREIIDATGLHVLPGLIDAHVHLNDPGRADWEGFSSGTRALAAGGFTCAVDMPLNSFPPTVHKVAFDAEGGRGAGHRARRLRALGRPRPRQPRPHGRARRVRRRRLQGLHGRQRQRGLPALRRPHAVRGHAQCGQARPAGRGARRERGDGAPARAAGALVRRRPRWPTSSPRARSPPRSRRSRARSRSPPRPAARCTSHTSRAAARPRWWPRRARPAPT